MLQVGKSLAASLTQKGVKAIHSTTSHDPHDGGAYDRSRRTLVQLLKDRRRRYLTSIATSRQNPT